VPEELRHNETMEETLGAWRWDDLDCSFLGEEIEE